MSFAGKVTKIFYIFFFWLIFLLVNFIRIVSKVLFIKAMVKQINKKNKSILYLDPFYRENAGTYYRIKKWADALGENAFRVVVKRVYEKETFNKHVYQREHIIWFQIKFIIYRFFHVFYALRFKTVVVRRTILLYNEYGTGVFMEKLLVTIHPNVILDFDDDINIHDQTEGSLYGKILLENKNKFYNTLGIYNRFMAGSEYLKTLVLKNNNRVLSENILVVPTCVDYNKYPTKKYDDNDQVITFGWIGTNFNLVYIDSIIDDLNRISEECKIKLLIISGVEYKNPKAKFEIINKQWSLQNEIEHLYQIDIGLMPLFDNLLEKGKCGFKLIQYMGLGIVSIASAVTANKDIIDNDYDGFLVYKPSDWYSVLKKVISRRSDFGLIGEAARNKVNVKFSYNNYLKQNYVAFVSNYKENETYRETLRRIIQPFLYYGFYQFIYKRFERGSDNSNLKLGITAVVSAKNEENTIPMSLKSLIGFADQIICIDNGSEDETYKLMLDFQLKYQSQCEIEVVSMPGALLGDCRNEGLRRSKFQWHLRWDADMIFKTSGEYSSRTLRQEVLASVQPKAFQLGRVNLYGDLQHTTKIYDVVDTGEPWLVKLSNRFMYREVDRFDVLKIPFYYKIEKLTQKIIFHCEGIKSDLRLMYRNCYFDWRERMNSSSVEIREKYKDFSVYEKDWQQERYGTTDRNQLIYRHQKEMLPHLKKFDPETYVDYPEILIEYINEGKERFRIMYKNGKPFLRLDSKDKTIENYVPTSEDMSYNGLEYLMHALPNNYHYKLQY